MRAESIPFRETNYFSSLLCDYLDEHSSLTPFYNTFPNIDNFKDQINTKQFSNSNREVLVSVLEQQYKAIEQSESTAHHIASLKLDTTYTITTGHQLNLFTGPLYFLYKIVSTLNLCEELRVKYPEYNFVPIYWMATEDHDFEEINHFNFKGNTIEWDRSFGGAVGELSTEGLEVVLEVLSDKLGPGKNAKYLKRLFENAYIKHSNLADATRYLVNELFGAYGLVVVDANHKALKQLFVPYVQQELLDQTAHKEVSKTIEKFPSAYNIQVNPREINLFYITEGVRERIVYEDEVFKVNNTSIRWKTEELVKHLNEMPECFSPNVLLRPLYQEVVLPNICYIGGGGELAYWLELKSMFEAFQVPFPMLLLRNSALVINAQQQKKLDKLGLDISELFLKQTNLIAKKTKELSSIQIDLSEQKRHLMRQFEVLYAIAKQTDKSFIGAVAAQEQKQINGLKNLEKRLLKAEKKQLKEKLEAFVKPQNELFPKQSLQERYMNFSELYLEFGEELIPLLKNHLNPLHSGFTILAP
ncbi:MAG: bacillithiol biosynthesis cysteine-adding enzyme BshC [Flavobacteriaceae bacterium]